jgi:hypothetical protein
VQRLKLDVGTIVPLHGRPVPMAEFTKFMSTAKPGTK